MNRFSFVVLSEEYVLDDDEDFQLLPDFPLEEPAQFQIFDSDCKLNSDMVDQLRKKFHFCVGLQSNLTQFLETNLRSMLTDRAASVYSWNGQHGHMPIMNFKTIDVLIGRCFLLLSCLFLFGNHFFNALNWGVLVKIGHKVHFCMVKYILCVLSCLNETYVKTNSKSRLIEFKLQLTIFLCFYRI